MNLGFYSPPSSRERDLFIGALQKSSPLERQRFLENECEGNRELRERVEELLRSEADLGEFLEAPALSGLQMRAVPALE